MKIALINDTHFGARNDNLALLDYKKRFFDNIFFPYLDEHNIDTICHLGDIVERRKFINIHTANRMRTDFLDPIIKSKRTMHIIPGNHDVFYKDTNRVNILEELLEGMKGVKIYLEPTEVYFNKTQVLFLPWICEENEKASLKAIARTKAQVLFAHLELKGFEMHTGNFCDKGHDAALFDKFDLVASGHFHHKSTYRNISYLGNPFEMTWSDFNDAKGFHTFDPDTRELEYISNPYKLFQKLHYDDEGKSFSEVRNVDFNSYKDCYVKVIVGSKTNPFLYDSFIQKLEEANPIDVKVVDDHLHLDLLDDTDIVDQTKSTIELLVETVRNTGIADEYVLAVENLLRDLYNTANIMAA